MTKYDFTCIDLKDAIKHLRNIDHKIYYFHKEVCLLFIFNSAFQ